MRRLARALGGACWPREARRSDGQALLLLVAVMCAALVAALVLGGIARGLGAKGRDQRAADLAALGGARAMRASYDRLFVPAVVDGAPNPQHLERDAYLAAARARRWRPRGSTARGASRSAFPTAPHSRRRASASPCAIRPSSRSAGRRRSAPAVAVAEAQLAPARAGGVRGRRGRVPTARSPYRQGKPMRPDVALAFDRMAAAATRDGVLADRRQRLPLRRRAGAPVRGAPGPEDGSRRRGARCTASARSSTSARRRAYGWLAANAPALPLRPALRVGAVALRVTRSTPGSTSVGFGARDGRAGCRRSCRPRYAGADRRGRPALERRRRRCSPRSSTPSPASTRSPSRRAGAQGIAQFMPGTARALGLRDPFDAAQAIDAQAHLMRDLLRQLRLGAARARRLQRRARRGERVRLRAAVSRDAGLRRAHPRTAPRRRRRRRRSPPASTCGWSDDAARSARPPRRRAARPRRSDVSDVVRRPWRVPRPEWWPGSADVRWVRSWLPALSSVSAWGTCAGQRLLP